MQIKIDNKAKLEVFVAIFQLLKSWSSFIGMRFEADGLHIQCMDKSHVCLANIDIHKKWFANYETAEICTIALDTSQFAVLINYALKNDVLEMQYDESKNADIVYINFLNNKDNKESVNHYFELNLVEIEEETVGIPPVDYDVEFVMETKRFVEILSELNAFGSDVHMKCDENVVELYSNNDTTKLKICVPTDELDEYAINENQTLSLDFSLHHLFKMCTSLKLSKSVKVNLSNEYPLELAYDLGDESKVLFYVAPKVADA